MTRKTLHPWLVALALTAGCRDDGSNPGSPTSPVLPAGRYSLRVSAPFAYQGCSPAWDQLFVSERLTGVRLTRDGEEWTLRSEFPQAGNLEMRFRAAGANALAGTISGTAITAQGAADAIALGVSFAGSGAASASVEGTLIPNLARAQGRVSGAIVFIDAQRGPMTCAAAEWFLSPALATVPGVRG